MGLLEEAIREHLELQRRRGGDPRQIALAEREALEPLVPGQTPDWAEGPALFDGDQALAPGSQTATAQDTEMSVAAQAAGFEASAFEVPQSEVPQAEAPQSWAPQSGPAVAGGAGDVEQETAELDMRSVLFESSELGDVRARRIVADPPPGAVGEPDFEWEIPGVTRSPGTGA